MAKIPSALSQYDNGVSKTKSSDGNFAGKLTGGLSGFAKSLTNQISSINSDKITQLNALSKNKIGGILGNLLGNAGDLLNLNFNGSSLISDAIQNILGKIDLQSVLGKTAGALSGYINNSIQMLKALGTDTVRQIKNASINYLSNIAEDYINNLKSSVYIDDKIFLATIKGLYYGSGADLAYNKHYLRNQCLKRDWCDTLKFVDGEYGIDYNITYVKLRSDIKICSTNSCHKNLFYIFGKLYDQIKNYESLIDASDKKIEFYKSYKGYEKEKGYKAEVSMNAKYKGDKATLEKLMVEGLKNLIVYSYTYTTASDIRRFFSSYSDILKPMYYGSNDDKYKKAYMFSKSDCATMLPFFQKHDLSEADKATMEEIANQTEKLNEYNEKLSEDSKYDEARETLDDENSSVFDKAKAGAILKLEEARNNSLKTQNDRSASMANTALTRGSKGVYEDSRARHPMQNDLKARVKYRDKDILTVLDDTFNEEEQYTVPRNKNIKSIYILLSSTTIYPETYMVNENFYKRCKYPTMTTLNAAADKAKGILGTSFLAQAMYDISDAIDGSAYRYTKKVEKYLLDPRTNISSISNATDVTFDKDNLNEIDLPEELHDSLETALQSTPSNTNGEITAANGVNVNSLNEMEREADKDLAVKKEIADAVRYVDSLTMVKKKEMLLNYMIKYYNLCYNYGIEKEELTTAYSKLTYYIFAKKIYDPNDLYGSLLDNATNESLSRNIQIIISVQKTGFLEDVMEINNSKYKSVYIKLYDLVCNSFNLEASMAGFVQMTFNYDQEHLSSLLKQYFLRKIDYLKSINDKSNPKYNTFYTFKDFMTKTFDGFDRNGIFGYSEEMERIRYTNIETGDWRAIHYSPRNGTFFAGSMNTKGNGIMKLNETLEEIQSTNITTGNWVKILEFNNKVFFINEDDSIWYWNGNNVIKTNITDYKNWEFDLFASYDALFLKGKVNNGIKIWKNNKFENIASVGDGWIYEDLNKYNVNGDNNNGNGYCILYPSRSSGPSFVFNSSKSFNNTNINATVTSWLLVTPKLVNKYEYQVMDEPSSSDEGPSYHWETAIDTNYQCHLIIATSDHGVYNYKCNVSSSTRFSPTGSIGQISHFNNSRPNILYKNSNSSFSCLCDDGVNIYRISFLNYREVNSTKAPYIDTNGIITDKSVSSSLVTGDISSANIENIQCTKFGIIAEHVKKNISGSSTSELVYYDKRNFIDSRNKIADRSLLGITFFVGEDDATTFGKTNNNYFICTRTELIQIIDKKDDIKPGWILEYVNNIFYLVNHTNPLGIRYIKDNKSTDTSIDSGYWNVTCSDTKIFALSIKNTNKGIKYTPKNNPADFATMQKYPYDYQDVYGYSYNPIRRVLYFGSCRDELLLNIDAIKYDIDLYIYILTLYQIKQKLQALAETDGNTSLDELLQKLTDETNLKEINEMIDRMNEELKAQISDQREIEKSSNLYTDLLTYSEAMREFDIDNKKARESLLLSMINNYDYIPSFTDKTISANTQERFLAKISYTKLISTIKIDNRTKGQVGTSDWNKKYNHISDDFLNSDNDFINYTIKS